MSDQFQRDYLIRLPLPLAQLYSRAYNAKDARARHDNCFYLFEALVKLGVAPLAATYLREVEQGQPRHSELDRLLAQLVLPSLGQWTGMLRELARWFGERSDAASHPLGHVWHQLQELRRGLPATAALYRRIKNGPDGEPAGDQYCSFMQLFDGLVQYRNGVFGHGGPRFADFYQRDMGPLLFPAVNELLAEGVLELLGPPGSRLVYLTELQVLEGDRREVRLRELIGLQSVVIAPLELAARQAAALAPNCVAILWPGRSELLRLDPLLHFRESELADEVLFLNRERNGRHVEYLSYTTGRNERDQSMVQRMARLLSRVSGRTVEPAQLDELAQHILAETPSVERQPGDDHAASRLGDYELLGELGRGGMGVVYLARQLSLGRLVALKMLPADLEGDEVALARFQREVRHLARCEHPHIVKVLASGSLPDGRRFYAMEYVPGCDLEMVWRELAGGPQKHDASQLSSSTWARAVLSASQKQRGKIVPQRAADGSLAQRDVAALPLPPLPPLPSIPEDPGGYTRRVAMLVRDAALALHAVHEQGVVHRDIKPANLMLTPDAARLVLMDFGLAKGHSMSLAVSRQGGLRGTLRYAAPEQLTSASRQVGPAADVRGLGATLWELLTRRRLFADAEDEAELTHRVQFHDVTRLRAVDPTLDRDLEAIVARATERDPRLRIGSAAQLAEYLQLYLDGKPLPIRPPSSSEMFGRWLRENRALAAAWTLLLVALVLGAGGGAMYNLWQQAEHARIKAEAARQLADQASAALAQTHEQLEGISYVERLALAGREWEAGNAAKARQRLESCPARFRGWEWDHARLRFHPEQATLQGHSRRVTSVACSADGRLIASASVDATARLWDAASGKELHVLRGHDKPIACVVFSPGAAQLATASDDQTIRLWDTSTGKQLQTLTGHTGAVTALAFTADGRQLVSTGGDSTMRVWDCASGEELRNFATDGTNACVALRPDAAMLAIGQWDGKLELVDIPGGNRPQTLEAAEESSALERGAMAVDVAFSADGRRVACLYRLLADPAQTTVVQVWDAATGQALATLAGEAWTRIALSPDAMHLASADDDNAVRVWNLASGQEVQTLRGHAATASSVVFSADASLIITGSDDATVRIWHVGVGREQQWLDGHQALLRNIAFDPSGQRLASVDIDHGVLLWDAVTGRPLRYFQGPSRILLVTAISPNLQRVATAQESEPLLLWDVATGEIVHRLQHSQGKVRQVEFSADGARLATADSKGTLRLWDAATGNLLKTLQAGAARALAFSPDGARLAAACEDNAARLWDIDTGAVQGVFRGHSAAIYALAFSPDGARLASGGGDHIVRIWDVATQQELHAIEGHTHVVHSMAFSASGARIASASLDNTVRLWDAASGRELHVLPGNLAAFSPDGTTLASAVGNRLHLWRAADSPQQRSARQRAWQERQAIENYASGHWLTAAYYLSQWAERAPEEPRLQAARAWARAELAQWPLAHQHFVAACGQQTEAQSLWICRGLAALGAGDERDFDRALEAVCKKIAPTTAEPELHHALCLAVLRDTDVAATWLPQVVELAQHLVDGDPRQWQYAETLGAALYRQGNFELAIEKLEAAARLRSDAGQASTRLDLPRPLPPGIEMPAEVTVSEDPGPLNPPILPPPPPERDLPSLPPLDIPRAIPKIRGASFKSNRASPTTSAEELDYSIATHALLAMAHQKLGQTQQAQQQLRLGNEQLESHQGDRSLNWTQRLTSQLLLEEAALLLDAARELPSR